MSEWTWRDELRKQSVDQVAHALWGGASGAIIPVGAWGLGWTGFGLGVMLAYGSYMAWTMREGEQREDGSRVWWDPWLDSAVFFAAAAVGMVLVAWLLFRG